MSTVPRLRNCLGRKALLYKIWLGSLFASEVQSHCPVITTCRRAWMRAPSPPPLGARLKEQLVQQMLGEGPYLRSTLFPSPHFCHPPPCTHRPAAGPGPPCYPWSLSTLRPVTADDHRPRDRMRVEATGRRPVHSLEKLWFSLFSDYLKIGKFLA